jgi:hypothetical protein
MGQGQGGGRPSRLTNALITEIADYLREGNYIDNVCALVGISPATFRSWLKEGHAAKRSTNLRAKFLKEVRLAMAEAQSTPVQKIAEAINKGNIKAAFEFLQRRYPDKWSKRGIVVTSELPISEEDDGRRADIRAMRTEDLETINEILTRNAVAVGAEEEGETDE